MVQLTIPFMISTLVRIACAVVLSGDGVRAQFATLAVESARGPLASRLTGASRSEWLELLPSGSNGQLLHDATHAMAARCLAPQPAANLARRESGVAAFLSVSPASGQPAQSGARAGTLRPGLAWWELLDRPGVAVGIGEVDEGSPFLHVDLAGLEAPTHELLAQRGNVVDDKLQALDRAGLHVRQADPEADRAA